MAGTGFLSESVPLMPEDHFLENHPQFVVFCFMGENDVKLTALSFLLTWPC